MDYRLCDHTGVGDLASQLTRLSNDAFADYEGAMQFDATWMQWYLRRPGTARELSQAALADDRVVSNVLVCVQPVRLGDQLLRCGIIDSVATDPDHRRQGLARSLMENAHDAMREAALDAAVLYTNPDDHPYDFYRRLGYVERARASLLIGPRPGGSGCGPEPVDPGEHQAALTDLINRYYADYEGFSPLGDELWRWHKIDAASEPTVVAELSGSGAVATVTFAPARLRVGGTQHSVSVACDVAATVMNEDQMESLLSSAPRDFVALVIDDRAPERQMVGELGLEPEVAEVSMVLPFSRAARLAIDRHHAPWYVMIESVIGV